MVKKNEKEKEKESEKKREREINETLETRKRE